MRTCCTQCRFPQRSLSASAPLHASLHMLTGTPRQAVHQSLSGPVMVGQLQRALQGVRNPHAAGYAQCSRQPVGLQGCMVQLQQRSVQLLLRLLGICCCCLIRLRTQSVCCTLVSADWACCKLLKGNHVSCGCMPPLGMVMCCLHVAPAEANTARCHRKPTQETNSQNAHVRLMSQAAATCTLHFADGRLKGTARVDRDC